MRRVLERKRIKRTHLLAVQAERALTGGQDVASGGAVEHVSRQVHDLRHDVFAVVQDKQRRGSGQPLQHHRFGGHLERLGHRPSDRHRGVERVQADQPGLPRRSDPTRCLDRETRLADPGRPDHRDQAMLLHACAQVGELGRATKQWSRQGRQVAARRRPIPRRARLQLRAVLQNLRLEILQVRSGFDAEFLDQQLPHPAVGGEGVGLPSAAVKRGDEQVPQALSQRVPVYECLQLADHLGAEGELHPGRQLCFE